MLVSTSQSSFILVDIYMMIHLYSHLKQSKFSTLKMRNKKDGCMLLKPSPETFLIWARMYRRLFSREARASQTHCHTTGSTSYVEKRADFECFPLFFLPQFISYHYSKFGQLLPDCQNFPSFWRC